MARFDEHIAHYDGVQGGAGVVAGTRTPVRSVVAQYELAGGDLREVLRALPHLNEQAVRAALAYYEQHRAEIDADVARHQHALEAFLKAASPVVS